MVTRENSYLALVVGKGWLDNETVGAKRRQAHLAYPVDMRISSARAVCTEALS